MLSGLKVRGPEVEALTLARESSSQAISESACQPSLPLLPHLWCSGTKSHPKEHTLLSIINIRMPFVCLMTLKLCDNQLSLLNCLGMMEEKAKTIN